MNILTFTFGTWLLIVAFAVALDVGPSYVNQFRNRKKHVGAHRRV